MIIGIDTTVPIASGLHFYGRWEVERYLEPEHFPSSRQTPNGAEELWNY